MKSLQALRAIAASAVIYFHAVIQFQKYVSPDQYLPVFGKSGVDLFFVLSGFLMYPFFCKSISAGRFIKKRLARVVPLYWVLTFLAETIAVAAPHLLRSTKADPGHFMCSLVFLPCKNPASSGSPIDLYSPVIVPGWTLNYEFLFYCSFSLCLALRQFYNIIPIVYVATVVGISIASRIWISASFYNLFIFSEFYLGILLAAYLDNLPSFSRRQSWAIFYGSLLGLLGLDAFRVVDENERLLFFGVPSVLLIFASVTLEARHSFKSGLLTKIGNASFSIYLTHIYVLALMRLCWTRLPIALQNGASSSLLFLSISFFSSISVGLAVFALVEAPLCRQARRLLKVSSSSSFDLLREEAAHPNL